MTQSVPSLSIVYMGLSGLIALLFPVALFFFFRRRRAMRLAPLFAGMASFVLFALVLEALAHRLLLGNEHIGGFITSRGWLYALYGGLMAGIFEETGRLCVFFFLLRRRYNTLGGALSYGIGHGGIEALLLAVIPTVSSLILSVRINTQDAASIPVALEGLSALWTSPSTLFLASGVERLAAVSFHVAASVLVWMAVSGRGPGSLYFLAILCHAVTNLAAGFYQAGWLKNIWVVEAITAAVVVAICVMTAQIYEKCSQTYTPLLRYQPSDRK